MGGTERVTVGSFKAKTKEFFSQELIGDYENTNLIGNISIMKGEIYLHLYITISDLNNNAFGGHLNSAIIGAARGFVIEKIEGKIERTFNE